ncbi:PRC-barrel domain-containing protein [uncultured Marinobacter sp.]|uniref:PRC-barrel domain-containing protein n=1 Tax=uncultured Marinobacter sp. TaxID=187379 RepID=UPI00262C1859|nr:PRC-barrel domain-containing protein [uncultured Marinobacter sp.]
MLLRLANIELSRLLHRSVKGRNGEVLGRIGDIILDARYGRIEYVKLIMNDDESEGEKSVAVPWSQFKLTNVSTEIELNISRKVLRMCATRNR